MKLDKVVEGSHMKNSFRYANGILEMFGRSWNKTDIQNLVAVANLLSLEGYPLKVPVRTEVRQVRSMFGDVHQIEQPIYDEDGE